MKLLVDKTFVLVLKLLKSTLKSILSHSLLNMNSMFKWELNQIQCCVKKQYKSVVLALQSSSRL